MPTVLAMSDFDLPTRSASGFMLRYIAPRVEPVQLFSFLARRTPFRLTAPQSDVIIGVGHGYVDVQGRGLTSCLSLKSHRHSGLLGYHAMASPR